jgi:inward rectifier potassium channel
MSASDTQYPNAAASLTENFDPGLTQKYSGVVNRVVNRDGAFNVRRADARWTDANPYLYMVSVSWPAFTVIVLTAFIVVNLLFAWLYGAIGHIHGAESPDSQVHFMNLFFFSAHTLTTVGYGNMFPDGPRANLVASLEALLGLMGFAIATGVLFGRFSRPSARFGFSSKMAVAPYNNATSLQFRVVNRRSNNLIEVQARVMLMTVQGNKGGLARKYAYLELEREQVLFLPLTWTVVHPITETSPFYGKTPAELARLQAEIVIMMRGYDETFGQTVYARYSYRFDEIEWGVKFSSAFDVDTKGEMVLWVDRVSSTEPAPLPEAGA